MVSMSGFGVPSEGKGTGGTTDDVLDRFEAICGTPDSGDPDTYPHRQCQAAAEVLGMDAVKVSVLFSGGKRVPLASSAPEAAVAESLEFTLGEGPSLHCHSTNRPVFIPDLTDSSSQAWERWPSYAEGMLARTPYRATFAFPLTSGDLSLGTLSLYRCRPGELTRVELGDVMAVKTRIFYDLLDTGTFGGAFEPSFRWLNMPPAKVRAAVWQAIGMATVELGVSSADAMALLRSYCYAENRLLDEVAADIISGRLFLDDFHP